MMPTIVHVAATVVVAQRQHQRRLVERAIPTEPCGEQSRERERQREEAATATAPHVEGPAVDGECVPAETLELHERVRRERCIRLRPRRRAALPLGAVTVGYESEPRGEICS